MHLAKTVIFIIWGLFLGSGLFSGISAEAASRLLIAQNDTETAPEKAETTQRNLAQWKIELEEKRQALEKMFKELLEEKSLIEMKEKSLKPGDDPAPLEQAILDLKKRIDAYDEQRSQLEQEVATYNQTVHNYKPVITRERVVYEGPDRVKSAEKPEEKKTAATPAAGAGGLETADQLESRRKQLDAEYQTLLKEKDDLMARQQEADTDEKLREINTQITAFNEKLRDYDKRRQTLNEAVRRYNEKNRQAQATEEKSQE